MPDDVALQTLIADLSSQLRPVRALPPPWRRAALWCGAVLLVASVFALFADLNALMHALFTAILAASAAFITSVPGRSSLWALLPLPPLALWLSAGTAGCLRMEPPPGTVPEAPMHPMACIYFIVMVSVPLSILLMWQITRACPLRPALTASLAGLASAGAAAVILALVHPFDATYTDLLAHLVAVVLVVVGVRIAGERALRK
jgi:hypothetical protein